MKCIATTLWLGFFWFGVTAQDELNNLEYLRRHYEKQEIMIPMRDGAKLHAAVYKPKQMGPHPILLQRTPYGVGPYGERAFSPKLANHYANYVKDGFIFVFQDVRGRYMSEGEFVNMRPHRADKRGPRDIDESTDTYDTIEWLIQNIEGHNGRVGMFGLSYPGFYVSAGIIDSHPALKAASPQAPIADWFWDDMHHHGAFVLPLAFNFFSGFGVPRPKPTKFSQPKFKHGTPDGYQFFLDLGPIKNANKRYFNHQIPFWDKFIEHPNYDSFWQSRNILPHLRQINCAVLVVGGLYDAEDLYGPFNTYQAIEKQNPDIVNTLVMGPWRHGAWVRGDGLTLGDTYFGAKTAPWYREQVEAPFFKHHLKDQPSPNLPEALVFETGSNQWRRFETWPPVQIKRVSFYTGKNGALSIERPKNNKPSFDEFTSDPAKPVPYTRHITTGWEANYMAEDQRWISTRPDVLVYRSEKLTEDLTLAGPIQANLWVSTTATDADWVVKLIDVYPDNAESVTVEDKETTREIILGGAQLMVRSEIFRGRFRESYEEPKPFTPNKITRVAIPLQDVLHTFKQGHRIMIHIQSTFFPFIDRNPQKYTPNIYEAEESDFIKARHRVYYSEDHPTSIDIGVLE